MASFFIQRKWLSLLLVLFLILFLAGNQLVSTAVRLIAPSLVHKTLGIEIQVEEVDWRLFNSLNLSGLTIHTVHEDLDLSASLLDVRVTYRLQDLFKGKGTFLDHVTGEISDGQILLRLKDNGREPLQPSTLSDTLSSFVLPSLLPELHCTNLNIQVEQNDSKTKLQGANLALIRGDGQNHSLRITTADLSHSDLKSTRHITPLAFAMEFGQDRVLIENLRTGHVDLLQNSLLQLTTTDTGHSLLRAELRHPGGTTKLSLTAFGNQLTGDITSALTDIPSLLNLVTSVGQSLPEQFQNGKSVDLKASIDVNLDHMSLATASLEISANELLLSDLLIDECSVSAALAQEKITLHQASCRSGATSVVATASDVSLDLLRQNNWKQLLATIEATLKISSQDLERFRPVLGDLQDTLPLAQPAHLVLEGRLDQGTVTVQHGILLLAEDRLTIERARFDLPQDLRNWAEQPIEVLASAEITDLAQMTQLLHLPVIQGRLSTDIRLNGSLSQLAGQVFINGYELRHKDLLIGKLETEIHASNGQIRFDRLSIENSSDRLTAHGSLDLSRMELDQVVVSGMITDLSRYLPQEANTPSVIKGGLTLNLQANGPLATPQIAGTLSAPDLLYNEETGGDLTIEASYNGKTLLFERSDLKLEYGTIALTGEITPIFSAMSASLNLHSLALLDGDGQGFTLARPATIQIEQSHVAIADDIVLQNGLAQLVVSGNWQEHGEGLLLKASGFSSETLPQPLREKNQWLLFNGTDFSFHLTQKEQIALQVKGHVAELTSRKHQSLLVGDFDLSFSNHVLQVNQFDWRHNGHKVISLRGSLSLADQDKKDHETIHLDLLLDAPDADMLRPFFFGTVGGTEPVTATIHLRGNLKNPEGSIEVQTGRIDIFIPPMTTPTLSASLHGQASTEGKGIYLENLTLNSDFLDISASGSLTDINWQRYLTGKTPLPQGTLSADVSLLLREHALYADQFKLLEHLRGSLKANLHGEGSLNAPLFTLKGELVDGEYRVSPDVPAMREIDFLLTGSSEKIIIDHFNGTLGGAPFSLQGSLQASDWSEPDMDLHLRGSNLLLHRDEGIKLRADTQLHLSGPLSAAKLTGAVSLTEAIYSKDIDILSFFQGKTKTAGRPGLELFSFQDKPFSAMQLNIDINAQKPLQITNNLIKGGLRPELVLTGNGELPVVIGDIYIDPGKITLPAGRVMVEGGIIRVLPSNPDQALLDIGATAKLRGYDITIQINGPVEEPIITLSSTPPLPEEDLLMLVLTGRLPTSDTSGALMMQTGANVAVYLGKNLLSSLFGGGDDTTDESILDRFDLNIGRAITRSGENTIDAKFLLGEDLLTTESALYLVTEKDVYDDVNGGVRLVFRFK